MPMLRPRRCSDDSIETIDWATGTIGPSARPRANLAASRKTKPPASPEMAEPSENSTSIRTRISLRLRVASASEARMNPDPAMAIDSPDASIPSWVLLRWNSVTMSLER